MVTVALLIVLLLAPVLASVVYIQNIRINLNSMDRSLFLIPMFWQNQKLDAVTDWSSCKLSRIKNKVFVLSVSAIVIALEVVWTHGPILNEAQDNW